MCVSNITCVAYLFESVGEPRDSCHRATRTRADARAGQLHRGTGKLMGPETYLEASPYFDRRHHVPIMCQETRLFIIHRRKKKHEHLYVSGRARHTRVIPRAQIREPKSLRNPTCCPHSAPRRCYGIRITATTRPSSGSSNTINAAHTSVAQNSRRRGEQPITSGIVARTRAPPGERRRTSPHRRRLRPPRRSRLARAPPWPPLPKGQRGACLRDRPTVPR